MRLPGAPSGAPTAPGPTQKDTLGFRLYFLLFIGVPTLIFVIFLWFPGPKSSNFSVIWNKLEVLFSRLFPTHFLNVFPIHFWTPVASKTMLSPEVLQKPTFHRSWHLEAFRVPFRCFRVGLRTVFLTFDVPEPGLNITIISKPPRGCPQASQDPRVSAWGDECSRMLQHQVSSYI